MIWSENHEIDLH